MGTINVNINYMGLPVDNDFFESVRSKKIDQGTKIMHSIIESFFDLPLDLLPKDVLVRYAEVSKKEIYIPFLPYSDKLYERLLSPFKSAKRCYCLGEYLASIELSAHLGEMLALLVWEITPVKIGGKPTTSDFEKEMWGSPFEKLGQDRRLKILKSFNAISDSHYELFNYLRTTRRKYFHLWSHSIKNVKKDALTCFLKLSTLIKEILQMDISKEPGKLSINPLLSTYLKIRGQKVIIE